MNHHASCQNKDSDTVGLERCYEPDCVPSQNSYGGVLTPGVTVFGNRALKEATIVK